MYPLEYFFATSLAIEAALDISVDYTLQKERLEAADFIDKLKEEFKNKLKESIKSNMYHLGNKDKSRNRKPFILRSEIVSEEDIEDNEEDIEESGMTGNTI